MAHMNESWHIWMSHVTHEWVNSMNMQTSMNDSYYRYEWVMSLMSESWHRWISHSYEYADINAWVMSHIWMSHGTYEWVTPMNMQTSCIYYRAHRGKFLNEKADRWADEGREDIDNVRWDGPSLQPTFSWTEEGVEHRCSMNKTLRTRVHLKVSKLQLHLHKDYTSEFLNRGQ